ncbi:MAG: class I tRNA ligase family protein, partial [Actinomycetales bacterium]|nr:class I tRNA ligase family protein [Actinomycetales bacterium]
SLRNYPDPLEMYDKYGSDAVRWTLMSSPVLRGGNLVVAEESIRDAVRQVILPLWSTYYFFTLYSASADGGKGIEAGPVDPSRFAELPALDRYVLSRTRDLVEQAQAHLDSYDIAAACHVVRDHIDVLTNWYVRTQRDRFWAEDADAFDTLWTSLETLTRVMAPLAPLVTEEIWRGLTGGRSVHLTDWPLASGFGSDDDLVAAMERTREVVSATLALRKAAGLRVRQPLLSVTAVVPGGLDEHLRQIVAHELNVREVRVVDLDSLTEDEVARFGVTSTLSVNARAAGPRLGKAVQHVIRAAKSGDWSQSPEGAVVVRTPDGEVPLEAGEFELATTVDADAAAEGVRAAVLPGGGFALLDVTVTPELEAEGYARDVVRAVQDARKAADLKVSDRIALELTVPASRVEAVETHRELITRETLAVELAVSAGDELAVGVRAVS